MVINFQRLARTFFFSNCQVIKDSGLQSWKKKRWHGDY